MLSNDTPTADAGPVPFPQGLMAWSGNRGGGVRRLFDPASGRPGAMVFETNLLHQLRDWARKVAEGDEHAPRVILLVGGPGNGKTEAVEATIAALDASLGCDGGLVSTLATSYHPPEGMPVPRFVEIDAGSLSSPVRTLRLQVVQDASVGGTAARPPAQLLVEELGEAVSSPGTLAYLCCVNRGVLDDAMIHAIDSDLPDARELLEMIARAVSQTAEAPACWPLEGFPNVGVWPMDAESLAEPTEAGDAPPAEAILARAIDATMWSVACAAGPACPFCRSRKLLSASRESASLLKMLRWFELATGKRWAFRDLFSLFSHILAASGTPKARVALGPCDWAAALVEADQRAAGRPKRDTSAALFWLVSAQYQHALFHSWDWTLASSLLKDVKDLGLHETNNTAMGLCYFLQSRASGYMPAMIAPLLDDMDHLLDPALAPPEHEVVLWGGNVPLGDFDARFSRSVREGLDFAIRTRALSQIERTLLERLADLDELLGTPHIRRRRPTAATRVQRAARDFACRITRRSVGARQAAVPDAALLDRFHRLVTDADGRGHELHEVAIQVEDLLNNGANFDVSLSTTFGQPMPPVRSRAILEVSRRRVYAREANVAGRPSPSLCFLNVEAGGSSQPIAVTYDLFKAVSDLERGLSPASLPHSVLALLDTTRARMAGSIVRDKHVQDRPTIHLGDSLTIERHRGRFIARKRGRRP
ncbi:hypothetical protein [Azospirillum sp. TSO35-2]|uniref:hypothetical protein n=1 Tax=Azospirillum sp. TSO35-2 TaxID=716796 RepID=UPI000D620A1E|nr:hypothetical protein [Azospirillum sp. TSO35-2]PWC32780.1 hypothetical protein TSO352_19405 [Azospirillum sp. TSO35-2]